MGKPLFHGTYPQTFAARSQQLQSVWPPEQARMAWVDEQWSVAPQPVPATSWPTEPLGSLKRCFISALALQVVL